MALTGFIFDIKQYSIHDGPGIAVTLLRNLGRELSNRLRRANRVIYQMDS